MLPASAPHCAAPWLLLSAIALLEQAAWAHHGALSEGGCRQQTVPLLREHHLGLLQMAQGPMPISQTTLEPKRWGSLCLSLLLHVVCSQPWQCCGVCTPLVLAAELRCSCYISGGRSGSCHTGPGGQGRSSISTDDGLGFPLSIIAPARSKDTRAALVTAGAIPALGGAWPCAAMSPRPGSSPGEGRDSWMVGWISGTCC